LTDKALVLTKSKDGFYYYPRLNLRTPMLSQVYCEKACQALVVPMRLALLKTQENYESAIDAVRHIGECLRIIQFGDGSQ